MVINSLLIFAVLTTVCILTVKRAVLSIWAISYVLLAGLIPAFANPGFIIKISLLIVGFGILIGLIAPLRLKLLSLPIMRALKPVMPRISKTEKEALAAGTVGWEGQLFAGSPDFTNLLATPMDQLTAEEQAFIDGPVNQLCRMIDDWDITHNLTDLPADMWQFIKEHRFFGMIIPKRYGGLEFSATAQMTVLVKLYGRSISVASTVAVPNSLGPAELLLKYGTEQQKTYYLPRLATGEDIPCFALTGPNAGSDAASIPDTGIVCKKIYGDREVTGVRLNWDKRYITLCPVATIIGLAFRLYDPENLLGKGEDIGITCALIPAHTSGVVKGRRHFPVNISFLNGPTQGNDVFVPLDCLIGGEKMAGQGWRMLMECLSVGRAISLPSSASGGAQVAAKASGAYARIRKQFNQPISQFEGIEEALARIAGKTYMIDSALTMTCAAIDQGDKSAVAGAILKYHTTEWGRDIALDAMDIHGGKGICLGPKNYLGRGYQGAPIGITVEGANILTRCLIIFGQGAMRCHPYVVNEIESIENSDVHGFDKALWGHVSFASANCIKSVLYSLTDAYFVSAPTEEAKRYYQLIQRYSTNLAWLTDFSMLTLGSKLKIKEKISARLGDILSYLYICSGVLKRFHADGQLPEDKHLVDWCCQYLLYETEKAMNGVIRNFPMRWARLLLKFMLQPYGQQRHYPSDKLGKQVAQSLATPNATRSRITRLAFDEIVDTCPVGQLEQAFLTISAVSDIEKKLSRAVRSGKILGLTFMEQIEAARTSNILSEDEAMKLQEAEGLRQKSIAVDDFDHSQLARSKDNTSTSNANLTQSSVDNPVIA